MLAMAAGPTPVESQTHESSVRLVAWRVTTWGDDDHAKIMPAVVKQLSDDDISALASYVEGLHGAGFKFNNPNVSGTCGCGSSFSV